MNDLILNTINSIEEDEKIKEFVKKNITYELDIWKRGVMNSLIVDNYLINLKNSLKNK